MSATRWCSAPPATSITTRSSISPTTASTTSRPTARRRRSRPTMSAARSVSSPTTSRPTSSSASRAAPTIPTASTPRQILASILGGGMSSRLFQEVREKRGLCYSVYAFHWAFADSGIFGVAASTGEDEVAELVPVVLDELRKATETITDEEVDPRPQPDPRRPADVAREPVVARRPARPPADPLGPPDPAAGNGRSHQPHHRRPREEDRRPDVLDRQGRRSPASARWPSFPTTRPSPTSSRTRRCRAGPGSRATTRRSCIGPRVTLRAPRAARLRRVAPTLRRESREFLKPFEPRWTEADLGRRVFLARLKRGREEAAPGHRLLASSSSSATASKETLVGGITLSNIRRRAAQFVNLGYWMGQRLRRQGPDDRGGRRRRSPSPSIPSAFTASTPPSCPPTPPRRRVLEKNGFAKRATPRTTCRSTANGATTCCSA